MDTTITRNGVTVTVTDEELRLIQGAMLERALYLDDAGTDAATRNAETLYDLVGRLYPLRKA